MLGIKRVVLCALLQQLHIINERKLQHNIVKRIPSYFCSGVPKQGLMGK